MKRVLIKEFLIFLIIFFVLSLGMHYKEWFSHPLEHINSLPTSQFGPFHPLFFSIGVYFAVLLVRFIIGGVRKLIKR